MALPKKGSRFITVDGSSYRWHVRRRPTYGQGLAQDRLSFSVESAEYPGANLVAVTPGAHPGNWIGEPGTVVLPAAVAAVVRRALELGWRSTESGPPLRMQIDEATWRRLSDA